MKLKTLKIESIGSNGLSCEVLEFAEHITHLYGPNGCGKTPILKSIVFCLGYPVVFRNDIFERCKTATLEIELANNTFTIIRQFSRDLDIGVTDNNNISQRFLSEGEYSEFLFNNLGFSYPNLVSSYGAVTKPFISTLLPLVFIDQDLGYSAVYSPPKKFIRDQFQEMVRLLFNLPAKNFFDAKKEKIDSKRKLDYLDERVKLHEEKLKIAKEDMLTLGRSSEDIITEMNLLKLELETISRQGSTKIDSIRSFDKMISNQVSQVRALEEDLADIKKRRKSISIMTDEINSEANAVSLNESSRQVFLSFKEICSNPQCGLFTASSDSYAKNLLYLKDQIKDLDRIDAAYTQDESKIESELQFYNKSIQELTIEKQSNEGVSEISALVASVSQLKDRIFQLQNQLSNHNKLSEIETAYVTLLNRRNEALEKYDSFQSSRSVTPDLVRIRADLRISFIRWLEELHTPNVSRDITFKDNFEPIMGSETVSQLSGSTRARVVLAYHAALIEVLVASNSPIKLLVIDTPKQQEIHNDDLDRYFNALKSICEIGNVQVIFSTTEYKYIGDESDTCWEPRYKGEDQKMFLESSGDIER